MNMNSITFDFPVHILSTVVQREQGWGEEAGLHGGPLLKTFGSKLSTVCMYVQFILSLTKQTSTKHLRCVL